MSAFVVDPELMDRVITGILACHPNYSGRVAITDKVGGINTTDDDAGTKIGRKLYALNIAAVSHRYNEETDDDTQQMAATYTFDGLPRALSLAEMADSFKAIQCLTYQCSEGEFHLTELYRDAEKAERNLAAAIVTSLPEYQRAAWG